MSAPQRLNPFSRFNVVAFIHKVETIFSGFSAGGTKETSKTRLANAFNAVNAFNDHRDVLSGNTAVAIN